MKNSKNTKTKQYLLGILSLLGLFVGILGQATPTQALTCNSATLTGHVNTNGTSTRARFTYATNYNTVAAGGGTPTTVQTFNSSGSISQFVSGLSGSTRYFYRLEATNIYGTSNGQILSLTTPSCGSTNTFVDLDFYAGDACGGSLSGALVTISPSFGNGSQRTTGSGGHANFGIHSNTNVSWTISKSGYNSISGNVNSLNDIRVNHSLTPFGGCSNPNPNPNPNPNISVNVTGIKRESGGQYVKPLYLQSHETSIRLRLNYIISGNPTSCVSTGSWAGNTQHTYSDSEPFWGPTNPGTYTYGVRCTASNGTVAQDSGTVILPGSTTLQNPTVTLTADDTSIDEGDNTRLRWSSNNAVSCSASGGTNSWFGSKNLSDNFFTGALFNTTTYNITCYNSNGAEDSDSVTIFVDDDNNNDRRPTVNLDADDTSIDEGDGTYIEWDTNNNPDYCIASSGTNGWSGNRDTRDGRFYTGRLYRDTTYRMECGNNAGNDNDSVTIRVDDDNNNNRRPRVTLDADRTSVSRGNGTFIDWRASNNPSYCTAIGGTNRWFGAKSTRGSNFYTGPLYSTTTFRMICGNSAGSDDDSVTIRVSGGSIISRPPIQPPRLVRPTVSVTADSINVANNGATILRWNPTNATSCTASGGSFGWSGSRSAGGGAFYTGALTGGTTRTYTMVCSNNIGSATDSVSVTVRPPVVSSPVTSRAPRSTPTSLVLVNASVDRNQPIIPNIDNTNPRPGDEINYTVGYQNIGTGSITNLNLKMDLPFEVDYMFSTPNNPTRSGNTLVFNLGTLRANGEGTVSVKVRVRDNIAPGTSLNFPAILSYVDPSGQPRLANANISAQVWFASENEINETNVGTSLGANVFGSGILFPGSLLGWLLLIILILILILLGRYFYDSTSNDKYASTQ